MWTPQYFVRYVDFPAAVEGVTVPNDDGTFDVYLSRRLSDARRRECLEHELRHISMDHFYSSRPVSDLEQEAARRLPPSPASTDAIPHFPTLRHLRLRLLTLRS